MALKKYQQKRKFTETPEPKGAKAKTGTQLRFVVQKHAASRLHYDFRLELDGVLKSWAVPKGASLNPEDKRLAMHVEDHPLDYAAFEGIIPKGNYGAGTVMVWDEGTYESYEHPGDPKSSRKALKEGYEKGDLKFILRGTKLNGAYALVKMHGREKNAWLLIKKKDESVTTEDVTKLDYSVLTNRTMEKIAEEAPAKGEVWTSDKQKQGATNTKLDLKGASKTPMPHKVKPMFATPADAPFDKPGWLFEIKWDGYRAISEVKGKDIKLYSRNGVSFVDRYKPVVQSLQQLGHTAVLDGEVVVVDDKGKSEFQLLQSYTKTGEGNLQYYVFDILWLDGHDLRKLSLSRRKEILEQTLPELPAVQYSEHIADKGVQFYKAAEQQGLEGVMAKDGESPYRESVRSREWLKIKTVMRQEAVVAGFTEPRGGRKHFGALVLGVYEGKELRYIGHTGGGFDDRTLADLHGRLKKLARKASPFKVPPKTNAPATWVKPELVVEAEFQEWTKEGHMRKPIFAGLREDKPAKEVRRERAIQAEEVAASSRDQATGTGEAHEEISGQQLKLTHLDKVYWPDDGYTKGDLIAYYKDIASVILPYLKERPESLHRNPHGIDDDGFFQKDVAGAVADWIQTVPVHSESNNKDIHWLLCQDKAHLVYMANLGCVELNPWHSRAQNLKYPDYLLIDLDAKESGFDDVVKTAKAVKRVLDKAGIAGYPKTSGKSGLHVCVPLGAKYDYEQAKQFTQLLLTIVHNELPEMTSLERNPDKRKGKIYLDYLQNRAGQTMAAPYCLRPVPGAPASTPLEWEEVRKGFDPKKYTIRTMGKRLEKKGDLWKPVLGRGINLEKALGRLG